LHQQLKQVNDKLQQLLKQQHSLQKENSALRSKIKELKNNLGDKEQRLEALQQQKIVAKLNDGSLNDSDKKELEKKLNQYIREIDRCIAMLNE
jgi:predicted  nucleic acid-binding Zn-ribbon protein